MKSHADGQGVTQSGQRPRGSRALAASTASSATASIGTRRR